MLYIQLAIAPVLLILAYIYYRDKYNKEPFWLLFVLFLAGMFSVLPTLGVGYLSDHFIKYFRGLYRVAYTAFIQAGFIEEFWKLFFVFLISWWAKAFDERFDGIVYAVFVSMGFAMVENIMYVTGYGLYTGVLRFFTAVPAHAIFGISMGYYLGRAKFDVKYRGIYLMLAFIVPWLMHGMYDFLIMAGVPWMTIAYIGFLISMYIYGFIRLKHLSKYKVKPKVVINIQNTYNMDNQNYNTNQPNRGFEMNNDSETNNFADNGYQYQQNQNPQGNVNNNVNQQNQGAAPPPPNYQNTQNQGFINPQTPPKRDNLEVLSILHYVWGGLKLFAALFVLFYILMGAGMIVGGIADGDMELQFAGGMLIVFGGIGFLIVVAIGILNILCGRYLKQKKNRIFCIVMSGLACMNAPLGTLLGIFTILEVEKPEIKRMFEQNDKK